MTRTKEIEHSPQFFNNLDNCEGDPCVVCGKSVKQPWRYWVHLVNGGDILHPDDEERFWKEATQDDLAGEMGIHAIGPDCAKKYKDWVHNDKKK